MRLNIRAQKLIPLVLVFFIIIMALFFFGKIAYNSWEQIRGFTWHLNYASFLLSVFFGFASFFSLIIGYYFLLKQMKVKVPFWKTAKARAFSDICTYIPGKIWNLLTRMHYLKKFATKSEILVSTTIEIASVIFSSVFAFIILNLIQPDMFSNYSLIFYGLLPLCMIIMHPKVLSAFLNFILRYLKKEEVRVHLNYTGLILATFIYATYWIFSGIAIYLLILSMFPLALAYLPYIMVGYAVAWTIGFLSVIFPNGVGVREGVLAYILSFCMPLHFAIIIPVLFRLMNLLTQFILAAVLSKA